MRTGSPGAGRGQRLPGRGSGLLRAGSKGEVGSGEVRAAGPSSVLYMHGVFKNNKVLFKGSSHPVLAAACPVGDPCLTPGSDENLKLPEWETSSERCEQKGNVQACTPRLRRAPGRARSRGCGQCLPVSQCCPVPGARCHLPAQQP